MCGLRVSAPTASFKPKVESKAIRSCRPCFPSRCSPHWVRSICCGMRSFTSKPSKRRRGTAPACCHVVCPPSPPTPPFGSAILCSPRYCTVSLLLASRSALRNSLRLTCVRCWPARPACWTPSPRCKTPWSLGSCFPTARPHAAPQAQYAIRNLPRHSTQAYAAGHDAAVLRCFSVALDCAALPSMHLLRTGPPGPMHCARLVDVMPPLPATSLALSPLTALSEALGRHRFRPVWEDLLQAEAPSQPTLPSTSPVGGSAPMRPASQAVDDFCRRAFVKGADAASAALLGSQAGPHAARVFTARSTRRQFTLALSSPLFRAILLCRLRLPRSHCRQMPVPCTARPLWGPPRDLPALRPADGEGWPRRASGRTDEAGAAIALNVLGR